MTSLQIQSVDSSEFPPSVGTYNNDVLTTKNSAMAVAGDEARWRAVLRRDSSADGTFVFGVLSTGVYCRPSCPARRPLRRNVRFFDSTPDAEKAGLRACLRCKPTDASAGKTALVQRLCRYMETHTDEKITLRTLSRLAKMSRFHLQRVFTAELGISPAKYLQACRFSQFKGALRKHTVTTAWAEAGYSSPSRVYETARTRLGMTPSRYRNGAPEEEMRFTRFDTPLGEMLLAASTAGVCSVQFLDGNDGIERLRAEFPNARLKKDDQGLAQWAAQVRALVAGQSPSHKLPLDIRGTVFQQRVWQELQKIPAGQTRTYSEIAGAIGKRSAVRAVAGACASNSLAVVVPCHRVVHKNGSAEGYRWGTQRKENLLRIESEK
jgi:AraC family transcriptional regulator, regulatory protein of adaptative response / methylated-DNA-[protein]-cysteine methyltransferase